MRSGDLPATLGPNSLSDVVARATAILEDEMALGTLHRRHADTLSPRACFSGADGGGLVPPAAWQDVQQAVDTFRAWRSQTPAIPDVESRPESTGTVLFLRPLCPVRPGETVGLTVKLRNESAIERPPFNLYCTDLLAGPEQRIAATDVTLSPGTIQLGPAGLIEIHIEIRVPAQALPGSYSGLLLATGLDDLQAVVKVQVT
jgi:hypothetical protein